MTRPSGVPCRRVDDGINGSVPRSVVDLVETDPARRAAAGSTFRQIGATLEADVSALNQVVPGLGERCSTYMVAARDLWGRRELGNTLKDAVLVRVPLLDRRQVDSKTARTDLGPLYEAMEHIPSLRAALGLLDSTPDWDALAAVGLLERDGDRSVLTLELPTQQWPLELGGPAAPGEVSRTLRLETSHATWRDRRVRRLVRVVVHALEIWPDPTTYRS